jgi:hypothetical protein
MDSYTEGWGCKVRTNKEDKAKRSLWPAVALSQKGQIIAEREKQVGDLSRAT